jgi:tetratricopeptide (TPR) repeat protein
MPGRRPVTAPPEAQAVVRRRRGRRLHAVVRCALLGLTLAAAAAAAGPAQPVARSPEAQLAYAAAMAGRKAEALAAVQRLAAALPLPEVLSAGGSGWALTSRYAVLVRFGLWDELIALGPPDPAAPGMTAGWLYGRAVALAARGRLSEAYAALAQLERLAATVPADARAGSNTLRAVLGVAIPVVAARIAASERRDREAIAALERAVAAEDALRDAQPPAWFFPVRHALGAQLLAAGRAAQAERVYRADLARHPGNGWALYGLAAALRAQRHPGAAARAAREFEAAWRGADVRLIASAFWFPGADTTRCECEREASADGQPGGELLGAQHEARVH